MNIDDKLYKTLYKCNPNIVKAFDGIANKRLDYLTATRIGDDVVFTAIPSNAISSAIRDFWDPNSPKRQVVKFGSYITKLIKGTDYEKLISEQDIRLAVEAVKATYLTADKWTFKMLSGEELRWAYHPKNYRSSGGSSNLNSCMASEHQQTNLDFYVYNPDTIKLLAAFNQTGIVVGRALVYIGAKDLKNYENGEFQTVLGKLYGDSYDIRTALKLQAKELGLDYHIQDGASQSLTDDTNYNLFWYVPLEHYTFNYYPWTDNGFRIIYKNEKCLTNAGRPNKGHYIEVLHGSFRDSENTKMVPVSDPFRPGQLYNPANSKWFTPDEELIWMNKRWVAKSKFIKCAVCNNDVFADDCKKLYDKRLVCNNHYVNSVTVDGKLTYALSDECSDCPRCFYKKRVRGTHTDVCGGCEKYVQACFICNKQTWDGVPVQQAKTGNIVSGCKKCVTPNTTIFHKKCQTYIEKTDKPYCYRCNVKPRISATVGEPVAVAQDEIAIAKKPLMYKAPETWWDTGIRPTYTTTTTNGFVRAIPLEVTWNED